MMASNLYRAKCAFRPPDGCGGGLSVSPAIITRSTPSSPCASVRGRVIVESASPPVTPSAVQSAVHSSLAAKKLPSPVRHLPMPSDKLEKASSEPSLKKASVKREGGVGSAGNRKSTPLDTLLSFEEGDLFEVLSKDGRIWWACRALGQCDAVGYAPAKYLQPAPAEDIEKSKTEEVGGGIRKSWWSPEGDSKEGDLESKHLRALKELRVRVGELHPDFLYPTMIPDPDYCDNSSQQQENNRRNIAQQQGGIHLGIAKGLNRNKGGSSAIAMDQDGLILPRKPQNPCLDSVDRQNLHRELLFNQKIGKSVLNQKSELQRAMERQREQQARREEEQQRLSSKTPFQRVIEERAKKLEESEKEDEKTNLPEPEFIKVHAKLRARMDSK